MFSRPSALRKIDQRTVEAKLLRTTQEQLIDHLGGEERVSVAERMLVQATAVLALRLKCALDRYMNGGDVESLDRHVVAIQNALRHNLMALGLKRQQLDAGLGALLIADVKRPAA
jgi:hypothetical protein